MVLTDGSDRWEVWWSLDQSVLRSTLVDSQPVLNVSSLFHSLPWLLRHEIIWWKTERPETVGLIYCLHALLWGFVGGGFVVCRGQSGSWHWGRVRFYEGGFGVLTLGAGRGLGSAKHWVKFGLTFDLQVQRIISNCPPTTAKTSSNTPPVAVSTLSNMTPSHKQQYVTHLSNSD